MFDLKVKQRGWSLAQKLTIAITTLVMVVVGGITLLSIKREQQTFRTELQNQADLLLDTLELVVRDPLYRLDADFVAELMTALGNNHRLILSGHVYDNEGRMVADANKGEPIFVNTIDPMGKKLVNSPETMFEWQTDQLIAGRAIAVGNQRLGAISIGLSTAPLQTNIARVRNRGVGVAIAAGLAGALLALFISRSITRPLQELVRVTRQIARGDLSQRVQISSQDELEVVANSFNDMASQLQHTLTLLEKHNETLELHIRERTQALSQALYDLQQTHTQLVQSEKMSSLGQLVAGVAHEINNPVNFIHGNLNYADEYIQELLDVIQLYQRHYPHPNAEIREICDAIDLNFLQADLPKLLGSMKVGSERLLEIVKSLRVFSRLDEAEFKQADVHEGINSTLMILGNRLSNVHSIPINVVKDYGSLPLIDCYPGQLNQVFMNILANAIDALEDAIRAGKFERSPSSQTAPIEFPTIRIQTAVVNHNWITVRISDNALGISETVRSKLFDPFFTTKPIGKGTGLGLSISYQIITERHRGRLTCQSIKGTGTEFVVEIPMHQATDAA